MNPKDQKSRNPSKSIQSSSASPCRTSVSQDRGSVSSARVPRPGSLASSWDPRVREREKEQERLRRAALRAETEARAREFQRQKVIEIFDHEEAEVDGTDGVSILPFAYGFQTDVPRARRSLPSRLESVNQLF